MKILITTDTFYPMINGVVISTSNLYSELKKLGHDVRILTLSNTKEDRIDGDIYYLKAFKVKVYPDAKIKHIMVGELEKILIEWKPDIIHSQTEFSTLIAARYISKKTGAAHIHTYHTMYEEYLNYLFKGKIIRPGMVGKIANLMFNRMDAVVVPTKKMEDYLKHIKVEKPLHIVPTGLDIAKFQQRITSEEKENLLEKYNLKDSEILVYVGRVAEEKNIDEVLRYFKASLAEIPNLKLLVVGGGPYLQKLKENVDKLEIKDKVTFTGMIAPDEIYKYYQLGKAFVTSSRSETQGLTYIEALASGLPVICRKDPCVDGLIINGSTGYTYEDEKEFLTSVKKFVLNDSIRHEAIANAETKAKEYSAEIFGRRIDHIYNSLDLNAKKNKNISQIEVINHIFNRIF
jgi:1,2-diacylglycerol 3-alpha-glucosyltransferase